MGAGRGGSGAAKGVLRAAVFILALLVLGGCAALTPRAPSVTLAGVEVVEAGLFEQRFLFKLRIQNPNDMEIPITGLNFEVTLNGQPFATGVSDKPVTVPSLGEAVLEVKAASSLIGLLQQVDGIVRGTSDGITYRIRGRLFTGGFGTWDFDREGRLEKPAPRTSAGG